MLLQLLYYFVPAYLANGTPPLLAKLFPRWQAPVDCSTTWKGKRLLGKNKTWRGVIGGTLLGGVAFLLQQRFLHLASIPYGSMPWYTGFLLGLGAILIGDCGESLLKRRLGVRPGTPWIPFDQIDFTVGAFLLTFWLWWPGWTGFLFLLIFNALLSPFSHFIGWLLGITKEKI